VRVVRKMCSLFERMTFVFGGLLKATQASAPECSTVAYT
jgi:hypothetical protein